MGEHRSTQYLLGLYLLFIVYGSLFPLIDWATPQQGMITAWMHTLDKPFSKSDLFTNTVAYIPLGFLLYLILVKRLGAVTSIAVAIVSGLFVSLCMEYLQLYLPARTSSVVDLALNVLSTGLGASAAALVGNRGSGIGNYLYQWRQDNLIDGRLGDVGLLVFALWVATQLAPFAPSLDLDDIRNGLKQLWYSVQDASLINGYRVVTYATAIAALSALLRLILRLRRKVPLALAIICSPVLVGKVFIVGRQLSLEALIGLVIGISSAFLFVKLDKKLVCLVGAVCVMVSFVAEELRPDQLISGSYTAFNWIPFSGQLHENVSGIASILGGLWPFSLLGFFALFYKAVSGKRLSIGGMSVAIVLAVSVLEYLQTGIAGRYGDVTSVLLAIIGWLMVVLRPLDGFLSDTD